MAWLHDRQGQLNGKGSAAILTKARSAHYASMKFDKMLGDREAQSQATMASRRRAIGLPKAIENVRKKLRGDADPCIRDAHLDMLEKLAQRYAAQLLLRQGQSLEPRPVHAR